MALEYVVLLTLAGLAVGFFVGRSTVPQQTDQTLKKQFEQTKQEFEQYRQDVSSHFTQTTALNDQLIQDYQKLYEHLSESAQTLLKETDPSQTQLKKQAEETPAIKQDNQPKDYAGQPSGLLKESVES